MPTEEFTAKDTQCLVELRKSWLDAWASDSVRPESTSLYRGLTLVVSNSFEESWSMVWGGSDKARVIRDIGQASTRLGSAHKVADVALGEFMMHIGASIIQHTDEKLGRKAESNGDSEQLKFARQLISELKTGLDVVRIGDPSSVWPLIQTKVMQSDKKKRLENLDLMDFSKVEKLQEALKKLHQYSTRLRKLFEQLKAGGYTEYRLYKLLSGIEKTLSDCGSVTSRQDDCYLEKLQKSLTNFKSTAEAVAAEGFELGSMAAGRGKGIDEQFNSLVRSNQINEKSAPLHRILMDIFDQADPIKYNLTDFNTALLLEMAVYAKYENDSGCEFSGAVQNFIKEKYLTIVKHATAYSNELVGNKIIAKAPVAGVQLISRLWLMAVVFRLIKGINDHGTTAIRYMDLFVCRHNHQGERPPVLELADTQHDLEYSREYYRAFLEAPLVKWPPPRSEQLQACLTNLFALAKSTLQWNLAPRDCNLTPILHKQTGNKWNMGKEVLVFKGYEKTKSCWNEYVLSKDQRAKPLKPIYDLIDRQLSQNLRTELALEGRGI